MRLLDDKLGQSVLDAAQGTAVSMTSPPHVSEPRNKVFRFCASSKPLQDKLVKKLEDMLERDPSLLRERSSHLGSLVPDGFTPLMAAAYANQVAAARVILQLDGAASQAEVDMQGRTALHIASEYGALDIVRLLNVRVGPGAPLDLTGQTPLGRAVTSLHKPARRNQHQLQQVLFSPGDKSVCGEQTPFQERQSSLTKQGPVMVDDNQASNHGRRLHAQYGYASMPGFRVVMEDSVSCSFVQQGKALLVGVLDGHGDNRQVSGLCATQTPVILQHHCPPQPPPDADHDLFYQTCWTATCRQVDETIQKSGYRGGSTAIWAYIDATNIVVANVGDCRCILIQKNNNNNDKKPTAADETSLLEGELDKLKLEEQQQQQQQQQQAAKEGTEDNDDEAKKEKETAQEEDKAEQQQQQQQEPKPFVVTALSMDHKPELPLESARVEKAGLSVTKETYYVDGQQRAVSKVCLTETDRLAVSRAFGDFEYKANVTLGPEEQAVVSVPDVVVHPRNAASDLYLVLACDGVWDVLSNDEVAAFVCQHVSGLVQADEPNVLPRVGDLLLNHCLERGSRDNMTAVVVALDQPAGTVEKSGALQGKALNFS